MYNIVDMSIIKILSTINLMYIIDISGNFISLRVYFVCLDMIHHHNIYIYKLLNKGPVFRKVLHNCIDTEWFNKFKTVAQFGISIYNEPYNKNIEIAHKIYISKYVKWCDYNLFHNKSVI